MHIQLKLYKALIWITLYASGLHFFDNVYFWDQYPEPAWLTREIVALLWIPLALLAHRAVDHLQAGQPQRSYPLVHSFVFGNWLSLGHYLFASPVDTLFRINIIIFMQVGIATLLFAAALRHQYTHLPGSLRYTARLWAKMGVAYGGLVLALELLWPSRFAW